MAYGFELNKEKANLAIKYQKHTYSVSSHTYDNIICTVSCDDTYGTEYGAFTTPDDYSSGFDGFLLNANDVQAKIHVEGYGDTVIDIKGGFDPDELASSEGAFIGKVEYEYNSSGNYIKFSFYVSSSDYDYKLYVHNDSDSGASFSNLEVTVTLSCGNWYIG